LTLIWGFAAEKSSHRGIGPRNRRGKGKRRTALNGHGLAPDGRGPASDDPAVAAFNVRPLLRPEIGHPAAHPAAIDCLPLSAQWPRPAGTPT
jgi:hypothetical protein